jgi:hypothetical protein
MQGQALHGLEEGEGWHRAVKVAACSGRSDWWRRSPAPTGNQGRLGGGEAHAFPPGKPLADLVLRKGVQRD